jgi:peptide deformylase
LKYPHPALRAPNAQVTPAELADGTAKAIVARMFTLMYASQGVGLAAPQCGVNKRILVYNPSGNSANRDEEVAFINPVLTSASLSTEDDHEGCLSFPDMAGVVRRHESIDVSGQTLDGEPITRTFEDWEARIFQHEYDHLEGVCYVDRLSPDDLEENQDMLNDLVDSFDEPGVAPAPALKNLWVQ